MTTAKDVLKMIKDDDVKYCDLRFTDPRGKWQHVTFDIGMIEEETFSEGRDRRLLAVAGTPAEGHGRTSCDLEQCQLRHVCCAHTAAFPISLRTKSRSDHWVSSAESHFGLTIVCRTGFWWLSRRCSAERNRSNL